MVRRFIFNVTSYIIQTFKKVCTDETTMHELMMVTTENVIIIKMGVDLLDNNFQQLAGYAVTEMGR